MPRIGNFNQYQMQKLKTRQILTMENSENVAISVRKYIQYCNQTKYFFISQFPKSLQFEMEHIYFVTVQAVRYNIMLK